MATITSSRVETRTTTLQRPRVSWGRILIYAILILFAIISVTPFVYMVMTSFKTYGSVITNNIWPWPPFGTESFQFGNYPEAIQTVGIDRAWGIPLLFRYFLNSIIVTTCIVAGVLLTSVLAAYPLAQMDLPGKNI